MSYSICLVHLKIDLVMVLPDLALECDVVLPSGSIATLLLHQHVYFSSIKCRKTSLSSKLKDYCPNKLVQIPVAIPPTCFVLQC